MSQDVNYLVLPVPCLCPLLYHRVGQFARNSDVS